MPTVKTITKTLYTFDELSDNAKERARNWWCADGLDYEWWDSVYEDAANIADILGIDLRRKPVKLMNGTTRHDPAIWFSNVGHYGNGGSSFEGEYHYKKGATKAIRSYAPCDSELHDIADRLQEAQRKGFYGISATIRTSGRNSNTISICLWDKDGQEIHETHSVAELLADFNHWIFSKLEAEYDYLNSDECVDETIRINEYTFDAEGNRDH